MTFGIPAIDSFILQLAVSAVRSLAVAAVAGIALYAFRVKSPSLRLHAWKGVLYSALAMPVLALMLPPLGVPIPGFLVPNTARMSRPVALSRVEYRPVVRHDTIASISTERASSAPKSTAEDADSQVFASRNLDWRGMVALLYCATTLFLLIRIGLGFAFAFRLIRSSAAIADSEISPRLMEHAHGYNVRSVPRILQSGRISVPLTMGALRPVILLPEGWREWGAAKLDAVLAHEVSHIVRHDALTQMLSLLHRAIFWFSPLAWWLHRHLENLAEQASDEAALSSGADRHEYARTLLGFFASVQAAPGRIRWQGVAMAKIGQSEERIENILAWRGAVTMTLKKSVAIGIVALAIPILYIAASARPVNQKAPQSSAQTVVPPAVSVTTQIPPALADGQTTNNIPAPALAVDPPAPVATAAPAIFSAQSENSSHGGYSYAYGYDDDLRFVIVSGKTDAMTMSGSSGDAKHVENLRKKIPGDFIWFQNDEKSYIIRDQATIDRARKLWAPQDELGKKQEALGKQQEELGKQQEALGARMEQVRVNVPDMSAELDRLKAKLQKLGPSTTMDQIGELQSEIGELQSKIGELQSQAGDQQSKFGEQQGALGEQQAKLGAEQAKLGEQQAEIAKEATIKMKALLDEAIKNGTAKPEAEPGGTSL